MANIPLVPHKGKCIYCVVDNKTGDVLGMYAKRSWADEALQQLGSDTARVETYVQKPKSR